MTMPNPTPTRELIDRGCKYCGGAKRIQIVSAVSDHAWADCFCAREKAPVELAGLDARNLRLLVDLLRREGNYSGVWFAHALLEAATAIEALSRQFEENTKCK